MTHRNEDGTPPRGEDPLALATSAPATEDTPLTSGDPETPPSDGSRPPSEEDPLTSPSFRLRPLPSNPQDGPPTGGEPGEDVTDTTEEDPLTSGGFRRSPSPPSGHVPSSFRGGFSAEPGDDPLTSGEFGAPADEPEEDPLTGGSFRRSSLPGEDPYGSPNLRLGRPSTWGRKDPLTSGEFDAVATPSENGFRGRESEEEIRDEKGLRWASFSEVAGDGLLAAPDLWERGSGEEERDDPLTSGEFGWRAAREGAAAEVPRPRRARDPEDDPLTSAEFRVPRSAELEAMRAEASAAAAAEKAADDEAAVGPEHDDDVEPVEAVEAVEDGEKPAEPEDAGAGEDRRDGVEDDAAEDELEIAEVPEAPVAEPEETAEPEPVERAGDVEFGARLAALGRLVELAEGRLDEELVADAAALLERAGERMRLSGEHTVVALAGGTGSGKSSLFNAVCGLELSPSGMRRPMTSSAHVCVWGHDGAGPLLDWLEIDKQYRYARAGAPARKGAEGENSLEGLVLIDLPDHDSIQAVHRAEVDRFVGVADLLVWVVDPQKYADAALHRDYIVPFAQHASVTLIVLNQVDRLQPAEVDDCVSDLRRLLESEGLAAPHIITTSAVTEGGVDGLREVLAAAVAAGNARAERLGADLDKVVERFAELAEGGPVPVEIDEERAEGLVDALTVAAGAPAVAEAMESAYELRAAGYVGWPFARWAARLRRDPLRMIRLTGLRDELRGAFSGPMGAQQGEVDNALHGITDGVAADVPDPWRRALRAASRAHAAELPDALGESLREILPSFDQVPRWWWLVRTWQLLLVGCAALGVLWTALVVVYGALGLAEPPAELLGDTGILPWVLILTACLFGMGALTAAACRNMVALSAARHGEKIKSTMREGIARVGDEKVLAPVAAELSALADFRSAVADARR
ncbi:P-loop NTPase family protein [Actinocorallia populi]|uniref:hypothetical protein n=1 Tax=Actinocorallia populi TaxID=2079200 RepID=UPI001E504264|nr:hypothetical protein [Actinocorallia populi]